MKIKEFPILLIVLFLVLTSCSNNSEKKNKDILMEEEKSSSIQFNAEKAAVRPVSDWADGFTAEESRKFVEEFNPVSFIGGDDIGAYAYLNLGEVLPVTKVTRSGKVSELAVGIDNNIASVSADGPLGEKTLKEVMQDTRSRMQGIIVMHHGKVVFEQYPGMPENNNHVWYSSSKVLTGLLIHMLEQDGLLCVEDDITDYITEYKGTDWEGVKIADVLHHQSGMDLVESYESISNPETPVARAYAFSFAPLGSTPDSSLFSIMRDIKQYLTPGTQFDYSTYNTQILGIVIEKVTNKKFSDVLSERVWQKTGMEGDAELATTPVGEALNGGVFASRLRDMARFGMLFTPSYYKITDTKIIDDAYFKNVYGSNNGDAFLKGEMGPRMVNDFKESPTHASYHWDAIFADGDMYKSGKNGQCIYVSPKTDAVVVWFSSVQNNEIWLPIYARAIVKYLSKN